MKGKLISFLWRKVFVMVSMTKRQIDMMNNLFKAVIFFVSKGNEAFCKHIHAGYLSCVRECERRVDRMDTSLDQQFERRRLFSLALDTALFGQEHVLSCVVRLVSEDCMTQFPLFFGVFTPRQVRRWEHTFSTCSNRNGSPLQNWAVWRLMGQTIWLGNRMEWLLIWRTSSAEKTENIIALFSQFGVCPTVWIWLSGLLKQSKAFEMCWNLPTGFLPDARLLPTRNGFARPTQTTDTGRSPSHRRLGGVSSEMW